VGITRCGNFYGGGDLNFNRVVPGTIRSILQNEKPIIRSDGTYVRDYIYISDAVNAYLILAESLARNEIKGEAFNFSTETPISVLDIVNKIITISGRTHLKPKIIGTAKNEIEKQFLSSEKAKRLLGWRYKYSLDEGIKETIEWYKKFFGSVY
jgi:CDP-glucose 4,6-dehydratase